VTAVPVVAELPSAKGEAGLRFEHPSGPRVVVCGLHGGAGTSTLAYMLATQAAKESPARVLLCETAGCEGDQSVLVRVAPLFKLGDIPVARPNRPRVVSSATLEQEAVAPLLVEQSSRYGLTVVDAGTLRALGARELLSIASHVVWITVAREGASERARALLRLVPSLSARQVLVVRADPRGGKRRSTANGFRQLAEDCCDRLVYMGDSPGTTGSVVELGDRQLLAVLTGLAGWLA
jgi:hypothetical protein